LSRQPPPTTPPPPPKNHLHVLGTIIQGGHRDLVQLCAAPQLIEQIPQLRAGAQRKENRAYTNQVTSKHNCTKESVESCYRNRDLVEAHKTNAHERRRTHPHGTQRAEQLVRNRERECEKGISPRIEMRMGNRTPDTRRRYIHEQKQETNRTENEIGVPKTNSTLHTPKPRDRNTT
jgi:hypothetical protein